MTDPLHENLRIGRPLVYDGHALVHVALPHGFMLCLCGCLCSDADEVMSFGSGAPMIYKVNSHYHGKQAQCAYHLPTMIFTLALGPVASDSWSYAVGSVCKEHPQPS
jgi:hypothetical protein